MRHVDGRAIATALADNVVQMRFDRIDRSSVENAKLRLLDMIGCAIGGGTLPDVLALLDMARDWGGKEEATVLGCGFKLPVHEAAMLNCLMGRSFDWGPLTLVIDGRRHPTHTSETTALTALALAEARRASGRELLTALILGDDLAARLWVSTERAQPGHTRSDVRPQPQYEPWGTVTTFAAAAIAGRLLALSSHQLRHAFGIAVNMTSGAGSGLWDGAATFKLSQGTSARSGILSARLAQAGWTGIDDPFFGAHGSYFTTFVGGCDHPEMLLDRLGERFLAEAVFKPYPGGRPTHSAAQAALELVRAHGLRASDIEALTLRLSPKANAAHYCRPYKVGEYPTADALFSYKYSVAAALANGRLGNSEFTEIGIRDAAVQALIGKITFAKLERPEGLELEAVTKDGRVYSHYVHVALGEPENPLSAEALRAKFMSQVAHAGTVSESNALRIIDLVDTLEQLDDCSAIASLAVPAASPFRSVSS